MSKVLRFKKIRLYNQFPAIARMIDKGASNPDKIMERYVATARLIARRSMKKAPKRPKSRFGNRQPYSKRSKKFGQSYWRKGQYSRPGEPPFYHGDQKKAGKATLRSIEYHRVSYNPGQSSRWQVGPTTLAGTTGVIPGLHEHGGSVRVKSLGYYDRQGRRITRPTAGLAIYPKRPYMRPALLKAKAYTSAGKSFLLSMNSIGKMRPIKRAT
jgi:hypothetical protein